MEMKLNKLLIKYIIFFKFVEIFWCFVLSLVIFCCFFEFYFEFFFFEFEMFF